MIVLSTFFLLCCSDSYSDEFAMKGRDKIVIELIRQPRGWLKLPTYQINDPRESYFLAPISQNELIILGMDHQSMGSIKKLSGSNRILLSDVEGNELASLISYADGLDYEDHLKDRMSECEVKNLKNAVSYLCSSQSKSTERLIVKAGSKSGHRIEIGKESVIDEKLVL